MSNATSYKELKSEKRFLTYTIATVVSRFGDSLDAIAFSWIMYEVTQSPAMIALIFGINFLPTILLQPIAGVLVERMNKKRVMVACDWGRAIVTTAIALLLWWGKMSPAILIIITLVNSSLEAFRNPAGSAFVPRVLSKEKYAIGFGLSQTAGRVAEIVGLVLAGGLIAILGSSTVILIDAATFAFSAIVIMSIRYHEEKKEKGDEATTSSSSFWHSAKEGFRYIRKSKMLIYLCILGMFFNVIFTPINSFQTPYIADFLKMGPELLSVFGIVMSIGMAVGSFILPKILAKVKPTRWLLIDGINCGIFYIVLAIAPELHTTKWVMLAIVVAYYFLFGVTAGGSQIVFSTMFTKSIDQTLMARVSSIFNAILCCMIPVSSFICSALSSFMSVTAVYFCMGIFSVMFAIPMFIISSKKIREVNEI